jgi:hypothetical protein
VVVETECGGASYRGRGRVAMATAHWPRGGDERSVCVGGGGSALMMIGSVGVG